MSDSGIFLQWFAAVGITLGVITALDIVLDAVAGIIRRRKK